MRTTIGQKTGLTITRQSRIGIQLRQILRYGLERYLEYEPDEEEADQTEPEEDEEAEFDDRDEEAANDDEPFEPYDYEWSPWCEDTDSVSLQEYLEENIDWGQLETDEVKSITEILSKDDDQIRITAQSQTQKLKGMLNRLIAIYDFNYKSVAFSDSSASLPDVRIEREEREAGYHFPRTIIDYFENVKDTPRNQDLKTQWKDYLENFTDILVKELEEFFSAESFEDGWAKVKAKLVSRDWTQKNIALKLRERIAKSRADKTQEEPPSVNYFENLISEIVHNRYVEIEFFQKICPFKFFFPRSGAA